MKGKNETELSKYKKEGKKLTPPLAQIGMTKASWIDDRLPEILWAVLIISQLEREDALAFFRYCLEFTLNKKDLFDITISGISKFSELDRIAFITHICSYAKEDICTLLRPILLFPNLPFIKEWEDVINKKPVPIKDWSTLGNAVQDCLWHQSQKATDCRWLKLTAAINSGKMHVPPDMLSEILNYPNKGDQRKVRPMIRAAEIMQIPGISMNTWAMDFWNYSYNFTGCISEDSIEGEKNVKYKGLENEITKSHDHYYKETQKVWNELIDHSIETSTTSAVDPKHEAVFGLTMYALTIFIENNMYKTGLSINGRVMLRILFETYATLAYLIKKEFENPEIWSEYRSYGSGQANLIYRKFEEGNLKSFSINKEKIEQIANEDVWVEFIPINLGHWDSLDLRKICEYIGEKNMYDKYYAYTSSFVHANWLAIRESVYQKCYNPLHRFHRLPLYQFPLMNSVTEDMLDIVNKTLFIMSLVYPKISIQVKEFIPANTEI